MPSVSRISIAPVKGFRLLHPGQVELTKHGVVENRRFFLIGEGGDRLRSSLTDWPVRVRGEYDRQRERLRMAFPDGSEVEGSAVALGETVRCKAGGRDVEARVLDGPWTEPLSQLAGAPVRVVRPDRPGASLTEPVTLVSEASIERLAREAGAEVDARRFRMLFTLAGCTEHEEDTWDGRLLRVGGAILRVGGPVDRCATITRHPETGVRDLDALRLIKGYRGLRDGSCVDFGVFAQVERPGRVRLGDVVVPT
jgi:uncharacterized protein YcbX